MARAIACVVVIAFLPAMLGLASDRRECGATDSACARDVLPESMSLEEVEAEEDAEARLMEMLLLQTRSRSALVEVETPAAPDVELVAPAPVQAQAATVGSNASSIVSYDHNGRVCLLCGKPLPERLGNQTYTEFRTDCGSQSTSSGPTAEALERPAQHFMSLTSSAGASTNGFCELNFAKSCVDAVANNDYLYYAKSFDLLGQDMKENTQRDVRHCQLNGFLKPEIVALQRNFTGLRSKALELCETKYMRHGIDKVSFKDMMAKSRDEGSSAPSLLDAEAMAAWNCAMGDLGCEMAMCGYSFCEQAGGKLGVYGECANWDPVLGMLL